MVIVLVAFYAATQIAYVLRLPVVMDEFDGAYEVYRLRKAIPYRDFSPYKTVLGYFLTLPAAFASSAVWQRILAMKAELVLINSAMLLVAAFWMARFARKAAVAASLALMIFCSAFLERSSELRVDMMTAWAGLICLLLVLERKYWWAGAACAVAFLTSQKGAFYFLAANSALTVAFCWIEANKRGFRDLVAFNAMFAALVGAYVAVWSFFASPATVLRTIFVAAAEAGTLSGYAIRERYWTQVLIRNPMYFILLLIALATLIRVCIRERRRVHLDVIVFTGVVLLLTAAYSQPWPYHFLVLFPSVFVLHSVFFDAGRSDQRPFGLSPLMVLLTIAFGIAYPASRIPVALARDNSYQWFNVQLASAILGPEDTYLAGTDIMHDREQSLPVLQRLGGPPLAALRAAGDAPAVAIARALDRRPPKLVIANYRIYGLPKILVAWIDANYSRLAGSILLYAPLVQPGTDTVRLAFGGRYRIDSKAPDRLTIDGQVRHSGEYVRLESGIHRIVANEPLRLRLLPDGIERALDGRYVAEREFYPRVYDY